MRNWRIITLLPRALVSMLLATGLAVAEDAADTTAPPTPAKICSEDPRFNAFDFWLGQWNVYATGGDTLGGTNTIEKVEYDCLITESWKSAQGTTGFSMNYFNPVNGLWRQVWVSNGYSIDYSGGLDDSGAMRLEGSIYDYTQGKSSPFRGTWSAEPNGHVRQLFEVFDQDADKWGVWFDGDYRPQHSK